MEARRGSRRAWIVVVATCAAMELFSCFLEGSAEEIAPPKKTDWTRAVKDIPLGPGTLDLGLNVRSRYEFLDNFTVLGYGTDDDVLLLRTRLSLDYRLAHEAHAFVEFQDARYWLSRLSLTDFGETSSYYDRLDLRQAYLEWKHIGNLPWGAKLGRQILLYCDRRLFGPAEWGNVGNFWWDAAKIYYDTDRVSADVFYARRILTKTEGWNFDHYPYHVGAVYARLKKLPVTLDGFYVIKYDDTSKVVGEKGAGDEVRHTFGLFSERPEGKGWDYGVFLAGQLGEYGRDEIRAFGGVLRGGYTFQTGWTPRLGFEINYASGERRPNDGVNETFDGIFGAMDIPYGWMNVVSWRNLEDYVAKVNVRPVKPLELGIEYHYFRLSQARDAWYWVSRKPERRDKTGRSGQDLGHEIDFIARWQINRELELLAGYSHFFTGAFVRRTLGSHSDANWVFVQLTYKF